MASYQDLTASNGQEKSVDTDATKAIMQADMDAALKHKQPSNDDQVTQDKSDELIAKTLNDAGDRVLDETQISRVIEMAWEDRTPFGAIEHSYGLDETGVIKLMRQELKPSSFRLWRQRVSNRATKHEAKRSFDVGRAYCKTQYKPR
ncbi:TIGR03643 family protein [Psychrobacter sp. PP-21]|nr:TIGR03643 family protein [Psychrobacter sp. PP-21]